MPSHGFFDRRSPVVQAAVNGLVAPTIAGLADRLALHWIDTIATVQIDENKSFWQAVRSIKGQHGLQGFYRGMSWQLLAMTPPGAILAYGSYGALKVAYTANGLPLRHASLASSVTAGFVLSCVATPIEKKRVCDTVKDAPASVKTLPATAGPWQKLRHHYKGFFPHTLKLSAHAACVFTGTEFIVSLIHRYASSTGNQTLKRLFDPKNPLSTVFGGFMTGIFAQVVTTPLDVIKTKAMVDANYLSSWQYAMQAYREGSLFQSMGTRLFRFGVHTAFMLALMKTVSQKVLDDPSTTVDQQMPSLS